MFSIIKKFTKRDWLFIGLFSFVLAAMSTLYFAFAWYIKPAGYELNGTRGYSYIDSYVYFQYINQIKEGGWLNYDYFTLEWPQTGVFNVVWFTIGIIARYLHLTAGFAYHAVRILLIPVVVVSLLAFIRLFEVERLKSYLTAIFAVLASGVGVYFITTSLPSVSSQLAQSPVDLWLPESYLYFSIHHSPNVILSWTLLFWTLGELLVFSRTKKYSHVVIAGLVSLVWFNFHPYYIPYVFILAFVWFGILVVNKMMRWQEMFFSAAIYFLLTLPSVAYIYYFTTFASFVSERNAQNITPTPYPIYIFLGFGLLIIFSIPALIRLFRKKEKQSSDYLLLIWAILVPILIYIPWQFQRRLIMGWQTPLAILTISQLEYWLRERGKSLETIYKNKLLWGYVFIAFFGSSALINPIKEVASFKYLISIGRVDSITFNKIETSELTQYLKENNPERLPVLSTRPLCLYLVAYGLQRQYSCREHETLDFEHKNEEVEKFYFDPTFDRAAFLKANGITYVVMPKGYEREDLGVKVREFENTILYKID